MNCLLRARKYFMAMHDAERDYIVSNKPVAHNCANTEDIG